MVLVIFNFELMKEKFLKKGFVKSSTFIDEEEVKLIKRIYNQILTDLESTSHLRSDLSG